MKTITPKSRVYDCVLTGRFEDVITPTLRRLSAFTRTTKVSNYKIGISNHPIRRFRQAHSRSYDKMLVLYKTRSIDCASDMERALIDHHRGWSDNGAVGGGGDYAAGPYFVYVVIRYHRPDPIRDFAAAVFIEHCRIIGLAIGHPQKTPK